MRLPALHRELLDILLPGPLTVRDIGRRLNREMSTDEVRQMLSLLADLGYVTEGLHGMHQITEEGEAQLPDPSLANRTPARTITNASMRDNWAGQAWAAVRPGADDHKAYLRRGF